MQRRPLFGREIFWSSFAKIFQWLRCMCIYTFYMFLFLLFSHICTHVYMHSCQALKPSHTRVKKNSFALLDPFPLSEKIFQGARPCGRSGCSPASRCLCREPLLRHSSSCLNIKGDDFMMEFPHLIPEILILCRFADREKILNGSALHSN